MRNSLDVEPGNKMQTSSDQGSVVYGYPVPSAASHPGYLPWTRTSSLSSSSSSSSSLSEAAVANHPAKSLLYKMLFTIAIGLSAVIVWHGIEEVMNTQKYPKFEVDSISFSPPHNETKGANWTVGVSVRNTNRHTRMAFDDFRVSVYYKAEKLSSATVSSLYLGPKNQTWVAASLQGQSLEEKSSTAAEKIGEDRRHGSVKFDVVLQVKMTYFFPFPSIRGREKFGNTELLCSDVQVGFSPNSTEQGTMLGGPYRCDSHLVLRPGF